MKNDADVTVVTQERLGQIIGITQSAVSRAKWVVRSADGRCLMEPSVSAYCAMLRSSRGLDDTPDAELNAELTRWRIQTEKRKDEEWRLLRCREMCEGILMSLRDDVSRLRDAIAARPDAAEIVALIEQVRQDIDGMDPGDYAQGGDDEE